MNAVLKFNDSNTLVTSNIDPGRQKLKSQSWNTGLSFIHILLRKPEFSYIFYIYTCMHVRIYNLYMQYTAFMQRDVHGKRRKASTFYHDMPCLSGQLIRNKRGAQANLKQISFSIFRFLYNEKLKKYHAKNLNSFPQNPVQGL